jgi:hypothetical protein
MGVKLRFKVGDPDKPEQARLETIDWEPANYDENTRELIRMAINFEEDFRELVITAETIPINYWSGDTMDVCRFYFLKSAGNIFPSGKYVDDKWVPNHIIAEEASFSSLVDALVEDQDRVLEETADT